MHLVLCLLSAAPLMGEAAAEGPSMAAFGVILGDRTTNVSDHHRFGLDLFHSGGFSCLQSVINYPNTVFTNASI